MQRRGGGGDEQDANTVHDAPRNGSAPSHPLTSDTAVTCKPSAVIDAKQSRRVTWKPGGVSSNPGGERREQPGK